MKMLVFILLMFSIIVSCIKLDEETTGEHFHRESSVLPLGSSIIQTYENNWMKWKFEDQCFMSRYLAIHPIDGKTAIFEVKCPD